MRDWDDQSSGGARVPWYASSRATVLICRAARGRGTAGTPYPGTRLLAFALVPVCAVGAHAGDFADAVVSYVPAPGQFVNNPAYNDPARALGAPVGGGTLAPDNSKLVSLGGFGGSITLRFVPAVEDDPANPLGIDAVVFGNATYVAGNVNRRFAEVGVIEISADVNGNGVADDAWYVVAGSHLASPQVGALQGQAWDSDTGTATPPVNVGWYPSQAFFPGWPASYTTVTFRLPGLFEAQVVVNPHGTAASAEGFFGFADCTPTLVLGDTNGDNVVDAPGMTAGAFYTVPDNPFVVGVSAGSGGGDGFDIAAAVDPVTGLAVRLESFDFVRVSTGVNFVAGPLGELSTEVGAVSRVRANVSVFDVTGDGAADAEDLYLWHGAGAGAGTTDFSGEGVVNEVDAAMLQRCVRRGERGDVGVGR